MMAMGVNVKRVEMTVADVPEDCIFIMKRRETEALKREFNVETDERVSFFVKIRDGKYIRGYVMDGFVPYRQRAVVRVR